MASGDLFIKKDGAYTPVTAHVFRGARGEPETALYIIDRGQLALPIVGQPVPIFIRDPICFANLGADWSKLWVYDRNRFPVNTEVAFWDEVNNLAIIYVQLEVSALDQLNWIKTDYKAGNSVNPSIGGIGSAPGQAVWDTPDEFWKGVYHLTQDTSGGLGSILDSTKNAKHATPIGFTGNAVEMYLGLPCTRFNGIDQEIVTDELIFDLGATETYFNEGVFSYGGSPARDEDGACIITQEYDGSDLCYLLGHHNSSDGKFRTAFVKQVGSPSVTTHYEELTDAAVTDDRDRWNWAIGQYDRVRMELYFNDLFTDHGRTTTIS